MMEELLMSTTIQNTISIVPVTTVSIGDFGITFSGHGITPRSIQSDTCQLGRSRRPKTQKRENDEFVNKAYEINNYVITIMKCVAIILLITLSWQQPLLPRIEIVNTEIIP